MGWSLSLPMITMYKNNHSSSCIYSRWMETFFFLRSRWIRIIFFSESLHLDDPNGRNFSKIFPMIYDEFRRIQTGWWGVKYYSVLLHIIWKLLWFTCLFHYWKLLLFTSIFHYFNYWPSYVIDLWLELLPLPRITTLLLLITTIIPFFTNWP